jgi:hypothetical protein
MRTKTLALALLSLAGLASAVFAQSPPAAAPSLTQFLAGLSPGSAVMARGAQTKSSCTVTLTCDVGTTLSCSSASGDCQAGGTWISCDGNRQDCPVCSIRCPCPTDRVCYGYSSCDIASSGHGVSIVCDGVAHGCAPIRECF